MLLLRVQAQRAVDAVAFFSSGFQNIWINLGMVLFVLLIACGGQSTTMDAVMATCRPL